MKSIILLCSLLLLSFVLTSCVVIDDRCHYETYCNPDRDYCYNDIRGDLICVERNCWDEWVCEDYDRRYDY